MGRISIELVPRFKTQFIEEMEIVKKELQNVDTLNIPDILKFEMRIPDACDIAVPFFENVIPHIRAVAVDKDKPLPFVELFRRNNIKEVLVILGDNPEKAATSLSPFDSIGLISRIKEEMSGVTVYAGLDPYRTTPEEEADYALRKMEAGADGFFTQPFFDINLMDFWIKKLSSAKVFWGIAPVIRESAKKYWEKDNKIFFPENFECNMDWNRKFAKDVLSFMEETDSHVYFMPITVDPIEYLKGII